jgi:hypothetical protein
MTATEKLSCDSVSPFQDVNLGPLKYETGVLPTQL